MNSVVDVVSCSTKLMNSVNSTTRLGQSINASSPKMIEFLPGIAWLPPSTVVNGGQNYARQKQKKTKNTLTVGTHIRTRRRSD